MQDQCNFFELSLNPNLYDPRLTGLAENAKAVLALHPPLVFEDCLQLRVSCRIHDGFGGRALSVPLADERVDGLLDRRAAEGLQRSTGLSHQPGWKQSRPGKWLFGQRALRGTAEGEFETVGFVGRRFVSDSSL